MKPSDMANDQKNAAELNARVRSLLVNPQENARDICFWATGAWRILDDDLKEQIRAYFEVMEGAIVNVRGIWCPSSTNK